MDISGLKQLFHDNQLSEASVTRAIQGRGWILDCRSIDNEHLILTNALGRETYFNSQEMAISQAHAIVFIAVTTAES